MPVPKFGTLRPEIDAPLEAIIPEASSATATSATRRLPRCLLRILEILLVQRPLRPHHRKTWLFTSVMLDGSPTSPARRSRFPFPCPGDLMHIKPIIAEADYERTRI